MSKAQLLQRLEQLIADAEIINIEFHGRADCKSCNLKEQLEQIIEEER